MLFADEPTGNLDAATGARIMDLLFGLNAASRTTLVLVTHDRTLAERCDREIRLEAGRTVAARLTHVLGSLRFALRNLLRDFKSGELANPDAGVAGRGRVTDGRRVLHEPRRSRRRDAGRRSARRRPAPGIAARRSTSAYDAAAARNGLRTARILSMPSVVFFGDESSLVALRAVAEWLSAARQAENCG